MLVNKRITNTIVALGVLSLILGGGVSVPMVFSIIDLRSKIAAENAEIERRYLIRRQTSEAVTALDDVKRSLNMLDKGDIRAGEELDFVSSLEAAASVSGVEEKISLETVNQRDISAWEKEIPLKLTATGKFNEVMDFLDRVERGSYLIIVNKIVMSTPQQRERALTGEVAATVDATVRWHTSDLPVLTKLDISNDSDASPSADGEGAVSESAAGN
jgi:hypothetical protein